MIIANDICKYIEQLVPMRDAEIMGIENDAKEHGIPIMELLGMEVLLQCLRLLQPKTILEIGTAIGYSAIRMAKAVPHAQIITIERDPTRYEKAIENIEKLNLQKRITVIFGDAFEKEQTVRAYGPFDCMFIDAAKGQYTRFFELFSPFLSENGVVFSDNVLFKGKVVEENIPEKRIKQLVTKIKRYNEWLMSHPAFDTTILTVGDGLAISRKR